MPELLSILNRLEKRKVNKFGDTVHKTFDEWVKTLPLRQGSTAISISTGNGAWDYMALKLQPNISKLIATDIVANPVAKKDIILLKKTGNWQFKKITPEKPLPFLSNKFDLIYHLDVVEHVQKPYSFLSEQYRLLKKGGYLIVGTPNLHRPANLAKLLLGKLDFPAHIGEEGVLGDCVHIQEFNRFQLQNMLIEIGFQINEYRACFFGICPLNLQFQAFPTTNFGKTYCQYHMFLCQK